MECVKCRKYPCSQWKSTIPFKASFCVARTIQQFTTPQQKHYIASQFRQLRGMQIRSSSSPQLKAFSILSVNLNDLQRCRFIMFHHHRDKKWAENYCVILVPRFVRCRLQNFCNAVFIIAVLAISKGRKVYALLLNQHSSCAPWILYEWKIIIKNMQRLLKHREKQIFKQKTFLAFQLREKNNLLHF